MLFNSIEYVVFLLAVFGGYWALVRWAGAAMGLLLGASLVFYASWNPIYLLLIVASSLVDYIVGAAVHRSQKQRTRTRLLLVSVAYNLGVLATFKYFNFFMESAGGLFLWLDLPQTWQTYASLRLKALLPVGISFFTFQSMSYTIDIYRRRLEPVNHGEGIGRWLTGYGHYLLYVSFFPQLVAGPIVRARDLLPQLLKRPRLTDEMGGRGLFLIGLGLFKKVVIADYLALNLVDRTFSGTGFSSLETLFGVYAYALQIYCDFSGYSDIAIGSALLLGFKFPDNFNAPYQARNLQDFWRRWHISLSTWLRDYLYISLGGSRLGAWKTYRNLLITMLLGGLWHGAGWNFMIWGALHGGALAALRAWQRRRDRRGIEPLLQGAWGRIIATTLTFHYVCFAWIFFRSPDLESALDILNRIGEGVFTAVNLDTRVLIVMMVGMITHLWPRKAFEGLVALFVRMPALIQATALVVLGVVLQELASAEAVPFIYFQF